MIEGGAADVVVNDRWPIRGLLGLFAIELGIEDGFDGGEGAGAHGEPLAGCFHPAELAHALNAVLEANPVFYR